MGRSRRDPSSFNPWRTFSTGIVGSPQAVRTFHGVPPIRPPDQGVPNRLSFPFKIRENALFDIGLTLIRRKGDFLRQKSDGQMRRPRELTGIRQNGSCQQLQECRFTCSVFADKSKNLPLIDQITKYRQIGSKGQKI